MNEVIKRLMLEAGYAAPEIAGRAHFLAELVVKECVSVGTKAFHADNSTVPVFPISAIEQHFGVKNELY